MTYYEAALQILKSAEHPLTAGEITERAVQNGLIAPRGLTPTRTMRAELYLRLGEDPRLVKLQNPESKGKPASVRWTLHQTP